MNYINTKILGLIGFTKWSPVQKIAASFLLVILTGAFLLMLPISNQDGGWLNFVDALFTSTSATCVTGLATRVTSDQFTMFGQIVLIGLMQVGGLGLLTFLAVIIVQTKRRLSMSEKKVVKEMLNQDTLHNLTTYLRNVLKYTFVFEALGMFFYALVFVPEFGLGQGLFTALFTAVSAFCNAGFDILGSTSLIAYATNPIINYTTMGLIIAGGLGFAVWFDLKDVICKVDVNEYSHESIILRIKMQVKLIWKKLSLHTKVVLKATIFLIVSGTLIIYFLENQNPDTLGQFNSLDKWMAALFQSVTLRTAGFATIDCGLISDTTKLIMSIFMFIGGSPGGTAGGVKTTTVFVVLLYVYSEIKNRDKITSSKRTIDKEILMRSVTIIVMSYTVLTLGIIILTITENAPFIDIVFEAASAIGTVGLSAGITSSLTVIGKLVIIVMMYLGRIGVITLVLSILKNRGKAKENNIVYPNGNLIVG